MFHMKIMQIKKRVVQTSQKKSNVFSYNLRFVKKRKRFYSFKHRLWLVSLSCCFYNKPIKRIMIVNKEKNNLYFFFCLSVSLERYFLPFTVPLQLKKKEFLENKQKNGPTPQAKLFKELFFLTFFFFLSLSNQILFTLKLMA